MPHASQAPTHPSFKGGRCDRVGQFPGPRWQGRTVDRRTALRLMLHTGTLSVTWTRAKRGPGGRIPDGTTASPRAVSLSVHRYSRVSLQRALHLGKTRSAEVTARRPRPPACEEGPPGSAPGPPTCRQPAAAMRGQTCSFTEPQDALPGPWGWPQLIPVHLRDPYPLMQKPPGNGPLWLKTTDVSCRPGSARTECPPTPRQVGAVAILLAVKT